MNLATFTALAAICAPSVPADTLAAIARTESNMDELAISGERSPASIGAAIKRGRERIAAAETPALGIMQISAANFAKLHLSVADAFDPCRNVAAGAAILEAAYTRAHDRVASDKLALLDAISAYNTGNFEHGYINGYVAKVVRAAEPPHVPSLAAVATESAAVNVKTMPTWIFGPDGTSASFVLITKR